MRTRPGNGAVNPSTESPGSDGPRLGRPRDGALTDRVLSGAQDVVIEQGPDRLSADALAAVTGVSRAAIYRRWPDTAALLAEIVTRCRPVPAIPDTAVELPEVHPVPALPPVPGMTLVRVLPTVPAPGTPPATPKSEAKRS
ncbi:hypothetical protein GCM10023162_19110 [Klenkia terrae]